MFHDGGGNVIPRAAASHLPRAPGLPNRSSRVAMPNPEQQDFSPDDQDRDDQDRDDSVEVDPALSRQLDENLKLLYRSKLETTLPPALQALVDQLMQGGKQV